MSLKAMINPHATAASNQEVLPGPVITTDQSSVQMQSCLAYTALGGLPSLAAVLAAVAISAPAHADGSDPATDGRSPVLISADRVRDAGVPKPSLDKLTQPLIDTPQSITRISADELAVRGVTNLNDALRSVPGISLGAGETSWQGNNIYLRGFTTRDDMFSDGQRDYGYYYRDPFDSDSIEVLKGPSSILFGRGSTGGVINDVTKTPRLDAAVAGTATLSSADMRRVTLDADSPLNELGPGAAVRLNLMAHQQQSADRDTARSRRWGAAPSLALGLGTPTRVLLSYLHQTSHDIPDYGVPWFNGRPAPVERTNFYGFSSDHLDTDINIVNVRIEHDFNDRLTVSSQARYSHNSRDFRITEAVVAAGTPASAPPGTINFTRNEFQGHSVDTFLQDQTDLTLRFDSGAIAHTAVTGFELGRENPEPTYVTNSGVPGGNLANPQLRPYSVTLSYPRLAADTTATTAAVYALDTLQLASHLQLMAGARWDRFATAYRSVGYSPAGAAIANTSLDHVDSDFSYRGALVYTFDAGSLYAGVGTSFNPSAEGIESLISSGRAVAQANLRLDPEKNRSYEIGSKWNLASGRLLLTSSIFRLEKYNARVPDSNTPGFNVLGGDQRVDGLEAELVGRLTESWKIRAGYAYLDSEVIGTAPNGPVLGAPLTLTPRNSSSLWTEYRLLRALEIGAGLIQTSRRLGQNTPAQYEGAPGYVILNAMAKYEVSTHTVVQLNLNNLTNKYYLDQLHPFHAVPGEGFLAQLALNVSF